MMNITHRRGNTGIFVRRLRGALAVGLIACPALAFEPQSLPPAARSTHSDRQEAGSVSLPIAPLGSEPSFLVIEGEIARRAWVIAAPSLPTLRIVQGLRADLAAQGYDIVLDCATEACGGFDFRFGLPVLPAPAMNVDLFDFRVMSAKRGVAGQEDYVTLLVSRGRANRYVQVIEVLSEGRAADAASEAGGGVAPVALPDGVGRLVSAGHMVLSDLDFPSGAETLSDRDYSSLAALAAYLMADPARVIVLVGHTDAVGSLEANTALSKRRAAAVRARLVTKYGVPEAQVSAQGAGYLAPLRSNLTDAGREANRRVEAVLLRAE